ncbi:MAG: hypothetical protein Q8K32_36450 [Archangium sp.]|nr:hypothetical protein [Archangium sp.]
MRRPDEIEFGQRLHGELGSTIVWRKIMPGFERGPNSALLGDLLSGEGDGARLQLRSGGPIIQYLGAWMIAPDSAAASPGETATVLESCELAFRWSPANEPPRLRRDFEELTKLAFRVMKECTLPGLVLFDGKPYRSSRIGKAAVETVRTQGLRLRDTSAPRNQLELKAAS